MEKIGEDSPTEKLKSQTAIRCAKAAILLSSIKNATKSLITSVPKPQDEEKIEKLIIELVVEREKLKKLKQFVRIILVFHFILLLIYPFLLNSL